MKKTSSDNGAGFSYRNSYRKLLIIFQYGRYFFRPLRLKMVFPKNLKIRMNTRKTRNHKGCGPFALMVELRGVEPLKSVLKTA